MNANWKDIARDTLIGAEADTMSFPEGVRLLMQAGFDGYAVDFRRSVRTYYRPDGEVYDLETKPARAAVARSFDVAAVKNAIRAAQALVPGYTYEGFCEKVAAAGCAGYFVSFPGRRVLYYGRTGETHTEYFPGAV